MFVEGDIHQIDAVAHYKLLEEFGFNRQQLEDEHDGFVFFYFLYRELMEVFVQSGQRFVLCRDPEGHPLHFRNGYLYLSIAVKPQHRES